MQNTHQKVFFIGHGSPMNIINTNSYTDFLHTIRQTISVPKAIIVISAHWLTHGTYITGAEYPEQIYDFYGFPEELYNIIYTPKGDSALAEKISMEIPEIHIDKTRGIDHAARAVLCHIYPQQNIPVLEISLDVDKSFEDHIALAKKLIPFRDENILFIGSGNIIHNLGEIDLDDESEAFPRTVSLNNRFKEKIKNYDMDALIHYNKQLPNFRQGIPTTDHYIPLLYTLGMKLPNEKIKTIHESIQNGSISMRSIVIE